MLRRRETLGHGRALGTGRQQHLEHGGRAALQIRRPVGRTSLEVEVSIFAEKVLTGERRRTSLAYFVFVALGPDGRPHDIPALELRTDAERARFDRAEERRRFRLAQRGHPPS